MNARYFSLSLYFSNPEQKLFPDHFYITKSLSHKYGIKNNSSLWLENTSKQRPILLFFCNTQCHATPPNARSHSTFQDSSSPTFTQSPSPIFILLSDHDRSGDAKSFLFDPHCLHYVPVTLTIQMVNGPKRIESFTPWSYRQRFTWSPGRNSVKKKFCHRFNGAVLESFFAEGESYLSHGRKIRAY